MPNRRGRDGLGMHADETHLRVEIVDEVDGLLHLAMLNCSANVHAVLDRLEVDPSRRPGLLLEDASRVHETLVNERSVIQGAALSAALAL